MLNELEGLSKGGKPPTSKGVQNPEHVSRVAEAAKVALDFLAVKNSSVKCVTTKGTVLSSSTFTDEDDTVVDSAFKNDDKILSSCLSFCRGSNGRHVEGNYNANFSYVKV